VSRIYGYARVSADDQSLDIQREALKAAGCEIIREEKVSGASMDGREQLKLLMEFMGKDDVLVVTRCDRLGRNTIDSLEVIETLAAKGAKFKSLAEPWADTTSPAAKFLLTVIAGVAELDRANIKARQKLGISAAKAKGVYKGGIKRFDDAEIRRLHFEEGKGPTEIRDIIGAKSTMTVYRAIERAKQ
jgi:DNA invertase Pin-like site-specific DNA recombinase